MIAYSLGHWDCALRKLYNLATLNSDFGILKDFRISNGLIVKIHVPEISLVPFYLFLVDALEAYLMSAIEPRNLQIYFLPFFLSLSKNILIVEQGPEAEENGQKHSPRSNMLNIYFDIKILLSN